MCVRLMRSTVYVCANNLFCINIYDDRQGDHRPTEKPVKGEGEDKHPVSETQQKKKGNKFHLDDAEGQIWTVLFYFL